MSLRGTILVAVLALPLLHLLGDRGLNAPTESRYTEIAREMLVTGDWVVPRIKGVPHFAKPPLTYWCMAASIGVFGFNEWAVRLPSTVAAFLVLLLVYFLGADMGGRRVGVLAALGLGSCLEFFILSRVATTDMIHTCLVATACTAFWFWWRSVAREKRASGWCVLFWLALGLGVLNKGPVPVMVVLGAILPFGLGLKRRRSLTGLGWWWGIPLCALVSLPWYWGIIRLKPELLDHFLGQEVLGRAMSGLGRAQPWFYFVCVMPLALLPWTPFIVWAVIRIRDFRESHQRSVTCFLLWWFLVPFVVFSAASSKLWTYILPIMAPVVLVGARHVARWASSVNRWRVLTVIWLGTHLLLGLGLHLVHQRELLLGNNASFAALVAGLPREDLVGVPIPTSMNPVSEPPRHSDGGTAVVTYGFRFVAAGFYLLEARAEYIPHFGGSTLFEIEGDRELDRPGTLEDLGDVLARRKVVWIITRLRHLERLQEELKTPYRILRQAGANGNEVVVAAFGRS